MAPEEIQDLLIRRPFVPLRFHVSGDVKYDVHNPHMAHVGRSILFLGLARDIDSPYFDEPVLVSLQHVIRIEPIVETATAARTA